MQIFDFLVLSPISFPINTQPKKIYTALDDHTDYMCTGEEETYKDAFFKKRDYYIKPNDSTAHLLYNQQNIFVASILIDKIGRRKLLLVGWLLLCLDALALAFCFYTLALGYLSLIFVLGFVGIYAATLGPVTWVLLSEIFPNSIRSSAMALATLCLWISNFFTTAAFPILKNSFGTHVTFAIHAAICFIYFLFIKFKVPETKEKSLEELEAQLIRK